jgi:plasmid stabilization system protein ParE
MRYEFHPEALEEYGEATRWYAERDLALAFRFIDAVEDAVSRIVEAPTRWRVIEEDVRRCLSHVFPYAVLYTIEADFILIVAVMHCSREPGYWKSRVAPQAEP